MLIRSDKPEALYARRRDALVAALQQAGLPADRITIVAGFSDGDGLTGESIVEVRRTMKKSYAGSSTDTGSVTPSGKSPQ